MQRDDSTYVMDGIPNELNPFQRAMEILRRAAHVGFRYPTFQKTTDKVREELFEVEDAVANGDQAEVKKEVGDLLHAAFTVARDAGVDAEEAIETTNKKFTTRFKRAEEMMREDGLDMRNASREDRLKHWLSAKDEAKSAGRE